MKKLWLERSERERTMLLAALTLAGLVGFYQFIHIPLSDYKAAAEWRYTMAQSLYREVRAGAADARAVKEAGRAQPKQDITIRSAVSATARDAGLQITRMQPMEDEGLNLWIDEADAKLLHRWLLGLQENYGISVGKASIRGNEGKGTVRAQLMLTRGVAS